MPVQSTKAIGVTFSRKLWASQHVEQRPLLILCLHHCMPMGTFWFLTPNTTAIYKIQLCRRQANHRQIYTDSLCNSQRTFRRKDEWDFNPPMTQRTWLNYVTLPSTAHRVHTLSRQLIRSIQHQ